ncbi:MAG: hypothetical protein ACPG4Z_01695 [Chitinophagales bacterium]
MKSIYRIILSTIFTLTIFANNLLAQCAMCRGAAETSLNEGNTQAAGINVGVLYILAIVFSLLIGVSVFIWNHRDAHGQYK